MLHMENKEKAKINQYPKLTPPFAYNIYVNPNLEVDLCDCGPCKTEK